LNPWLPLLLLLLLLLLLRDSALTALAEGPMKYGTDAVAVVVIVVVAALWAKVK